MLTDRGTVGTPPPLPIAICVEERWVEYAMVLRNSPPLARSHSGMSGALIGNMVLLQRKTPLPVAHCIIVLPLRNQRQKVIEEASPSQGGPTPLPEALKT